MMKFRSMVGCNLESGEGALCPVDAVVPENSDDGWE
jgi:hypothetical protein